MSDNKKNGRTAAEQLRSKMQSEAGAKAETGSAPDANTNSDIDIQELLRKYLPEYADSSGNAQTSAKTESTAASEPDFDTKSYFPTEDTAEESDPNAQTQEYVIPFDEEEKPVKKGGLFSRFRRNQDDGAEEDRAVPDGDLFDQLIDAQTENTDAADEPAVESEANAAEETSDPFDEMDETDRNLMVAFGLEEQLDEKAGAGTADKIAAENDEAERRAEEEKRRAMEYEYTERSQTPKIAEAYKYSFRSLKWKIFAAAILTAVLFFFENITLFGVQFAGALDPAVYPVVYCMVSLQLMLLVCAVAYEQIMTGISNLLTARPTPESVSAVLAVFGVLYSSYIAIIAVQGEEPKMYNFAVAVCALMSLVFTYFNTKREMFSFNVISSKKSKYVLRRIPAGESSPESKAFGTEEEEDGPDVLRIQKVGFVDGYFGRSAAILHTTRVYVTAMLTVVAAASVLLAVLAAVGGASAKDAVTVAYISVLAAVPISMFFTYSYPFYKANREAYEYDSTIVGESSLEEYPGASIISFDDTNVFPSYGVKVQNIKVYNNNRIDRILYYAASTFAAVGGPLCDVFDVATMEMGHSDDVELVGADTGYLETVVDGRHIIFGRSAVLTEMGIDLPAEIVEEDSYIEGDFGVMYMVRDGALIAKMFIKYVMDADFEFILRQFTQNGTCVCVNTYDPNIDMDMILSKVKGKKYPLKVIKNSAEDAVAERAESGIVTRSTPKSLLQVVGYCDMVLSVKRTNAVISVVAALISLVVMLIVALSGSVDRIGSWLIVVNQIFWTLPAMLTTKLFIK